MALEVLEWPREMVEHDSGLEVGDEEEKTSPIGIVFEKRLATVSSIIKMVILTLNYFLNSSHSLFFSFVAVLIPNYFSDGALFSFAV